MRSKVLIIDDDADIRRGLGVRLHANGYEVLFAVDGLSATATALQARPDLIVLDLGLPAGDGFIVMSRLRNLPALSATPIIVLTARDGAVVREKAMKAGAAAFLQKPADIDILLESIATALAGARTGAQA